MKFRSGDLITVIMARNDIFPFQTGRRIWNVRVEDVPGDTGDQWTLRNENGIRFTINPNAAEFNGMVEQEAWVHL